MAPGQSGRAGDRAVKAVMGVLRVDYDSVQIKDYLFSEKDVKVAHNRRYSVTNIHVVVI